ncbi:unnamed protein product [Timema podura]|uniref:Uncharacterized protein n=1 Tax=Timema podura TaxID=61482 RepID=A0ABN7NQ61_TIMPD|nr:unnamed protein product [Timema podura]
MLVSQFWHSSSNHFNRCAMSRTFTWYTCDLSLSIKNKTLRFQLNTDKVKKYLTMILLSFEQDGNYLENLIAWLTEPYCVESKSR